MAKRRRSATTRGLAANRSRGQRKTTGASSRGASSKRGAAARETMTGYSGGESQAGGGGMMAGARSMAAKVGRTTKDAAGSTVGAAREWAAGAADVAGNVASRAGEMGSQVAGKVRENPWPTLLIGAGATWLAVDAIRGRGGEPERNGGRRASGRRVASERGTVSRAVSKVASAGRAAGGQIEEFVRERPLLAGAATLGLGVAVGMAMPSSVTENEMFGNARDRIISRARDAARGTMNKVRDAAESVERIGPFGGSSEPSRGGSRGRRGSRG
jgi:ElaB/YqjD/DUF883 family membrane-anchored ribosome-binding protein